MEVDKLLVLGDEKLGPKGPDTGNVDKVYVKFPNSMTEVNRYHADGAPKHPRYYWERLPERTKGLVLKQYKSKRHNGIRSSIWDKTWKRSLWKNSKQTYR